MKAKKKDQKILYIYIDSELRKRIGILGSVLDLSITEIVNLAITDYLNKSVNEKAINNALIKQPV